MDINVTVDKAKMIEYLNQMRRNIYRARKRGLLDLSNAYRTQIKDVLTTGNYGAWPKAHPVSAKLTTKKGRRVPFAWLGGFARYFLSRDNRRSTVSFGTDKPVDSLIEIASKVERVSLIAVTPKMRRLFGRAGFPLRRETKTLKTHARPYLESVYARVSLDIFEKKFREVLKED